MQNTTVQLWGTMEEVATTKAVTDYKARVQTGRKAVSESKYKTAQQRLSLAADALKFADLDSYYMAIRELITARVIKTLNMHGYRIEIDNYGDVCSEIDLCLYYQVKHFDQVQDKQSKKVYTKLTDFVEKSERSFLFGVLANRVYTKVQTWMRQQNKLNRQLTLDAIAGSNDMEDLDCTLMDTLESRAAQLEMTVAETVDCLRANLTTTEYNMLVKRVATGDTAFKFDNGSRASGQAIKRIQDKIIGSGITGDEMIEWLSSMADNMQDDLWYMDSTDRDKLVRDKIAPTIADEVVKRDKIKLATIIRKISR